AVVEKAHRDGEVAPREVLRQQRGRIDLDRVAVELDVLELVLLGEDARDLSPGRGALLDEDLAEPLLRLVPLLGDRTLELLRGDGAVADEQGAESGPRIAGGFHTGVIGRPPP